MKIAMIIVRTLVGLLFIFSSVAYFLNLVEPPPLEGPIKAFNEGMAATGYFLPLLKGTELVCGIALVAGRFVPLALIILAPIVINIFFVHLFIAPEGLVIGIVLVVLLAFLGYCHRDSYRELLKP